MHSESSSGVGGLMLAHVRVLTLQGKTPRKGMTAAALRRASSLRFPGLQCRIRRHLRRGERGGVESGRTRIFFGESHVVSMLVPC